MQGPHPDPQGKGRFGRSTIQLKRAIANCCCHIENRNEKGFRFSPNDFIACYNAILLVKIVYHIGGDDPWKLCFLFGSQHRKNSIQAGEGRVEGSFLSNECNLETKTLVSRSTSLGHRLKVKVK